MPDMWVLKGTTKVIMNGSMVVPSVLISNKTQILAVNGGPPNNSENDLCSIYDILSGTWDSGITNFSAEVLFSPQITVFNNNSIIAAGCFDGAPNVSSRTALFTTFPPEQSGNLNVGRTGACIAAFNGTTPIIAGGVSSSSVTIASSERFSSGVWTLDSSLNAARHDFSLTTLQDGRLLAAGGESTGTWESVGNPMTSAEIYNSTWTTVASMNVARSYFRAILLNNGKVLVVGGIDSTNHAITSCEVYDPNANTWTSVANLNTARCYAELTLLNDGRVIVVGGMNQIEATAFRSAEIYDPVGNSWTTVAPYPLSSFIRGGLVTLPNGDVLAIGGSFALTSVYRYHVGSDTWSLDTNQLVNGQYERTSAAIRPSDGTIMVIGSVEASEPNIGFYDSGTGLVTWTCAFKTKVGRTYAPIILLSTGKVLVAGGDIGGRTTNCELFDPTTKIWNNTGSLPTAIGYMPLVDLENGNILSVGGNDNITPVTTSCYLYNVVSGTWSTTGSTHNPSETYSNSAFLAANGKVYAITNQTGNFHTERYDVGTGLWTDLGQSFAFGTPFSGLIGLENGNGALFFVKNQSKVYRFDELTETWNSGVDVSSFGSFLNNHMSATLNNDGDVYFAGFGDTTALKYITSTDTIVSILSAPYNISDEVNVWLDVPSNNIVLLHGGFGSVQPTYEFVTPITLNLSDSILSSDSLASQLEILETFSDSQSSTDTFPQSFSIQSDGIVPVQTPVVETLVKQLIPSDVKIFFNIKE